MNKKLNIFFTNLGLNVTGNSAYGNLKGFEVSVNVSMLDQVSPVKIYVNLFADEDTKLTIVNRIKALNYKNFTVNMDTYGIILGFNDPLTVGKLLNRMPDMLDKIFEVLTTYSAKGSGYCPICGEELKEDSKKIKNGWVLVTIDNECITKLNNIIEIENKEFNDMPNNYFKGAMGACLGAVVGIVAYVILFFIGFITSLTSFIAIILGSYLYKKFGGKQNFVMIIILSVISILSMVLAVFGIYVLAAQNLAPLFEFSSTGIKAFTDMMTIKEFNLEFITNLGLTLFYTLLGVVFEIYKLSKSVKRQGKIG